MKVTATTEEALREEAVPWPKTIEELTEYIQSLVELQHDYGTCVYAMSMSAVAAINYVASQLGVTGFQASCADMDILRRQRGIKGGFILLKAEDMLYPQYDLKEKLREFMNSQDTVQWLAEQAEQKIKDKPEAHPEVLGHWKKLAERNKKGSGE